MQIAYKYRVYPTKAQRTLLSKSFGCSRLVYNRALSAEIESYSATKKRLGYTWLANNLLVPLKRNSDFDFLNEVSSVALQQSLRRLDRAYTSFFRGLKKKTKVGKPRYKSKSDSCRSVYLTSNAFRFRKRSLHIAKLGFLKCRFSKELCSIPSSLTLIKDAADRYFVSLIVESQKTCRRGRGQLGIDLDLRDFCITSDGKKVKQPKFINIFARKIAKKRRLLSKKQKASKNRGRARVRVARVYAALKDVRDDFLHKLSTSLIRENQSIYAEGVKSSDLLSGNNREMKRVGRAKNRSLNRAILNASWARFLQMLEYKKAQLYNRTFKRVDPRYTSQQCFSCKSINSRVENLLVRRWRCSSCNTFHDRDVNAAKNILTVRLTGIACGAKIRLRSNLSVRSEAGSDGSDLALS